MKSEYKNILKSCSKKRTALEALTGHTQKEIKEFMLRCVFLLVNIILAFLYSFFTDPEEDITFILFNSSILSICFMSVEVFAFSIFEVILQSIFVELPLNFRET